MPHSRNSKIIRTIVHCLLRVHHRPVRGSLRATLSVFALSSLDSADFVIRNRPFCCMACLGVGSRRSPAPERRCPIRFCPPFLLGNRSLRATVLI